MNAAPHLIDAAWLRSPALMRVLAMLNRGGEEARVVGGAARNALMGLPLNDIDIATTTLPDEVVRRAEAAGLRAVPTGIEHGTVTLVADGMPFEVTTLRQDVETFGRKAKVAFGRDWKVDAERRDFTMNALSITADGVIHDYVDGLADLEARRIRFIGDPARRIAEDYLRVLRFFRFQASYALGSPDPAGLSACIAARDGLRSLSRERVRAELMKLLVAPFAAATVTVMAEAGFMTMLFGGVALIESFAAMERVEAAVGLLPDPMRRLAALGVLVTEDAGRLREKLRLFNAEHDRLFSMADGWWRLSPAVGEAAQLGEAGQQSLLYRIGPERYIDRVLLAWARAPHSISDPAWRRLAGLPSRWTPPRFPLKAADFIARSVPKGPALGASMRAAEEAWIAAGFPADEAALTRIADAAADAARPVAPAAEG
jgi:tRNA nucleotidyltransferase/poly(A) polymerase